MIIIKKGKKKKQRRMNRFKNHIVLFCLSAFFVMVFTSSCVSTKTQPITLIKKRSEDDKKVEKEHKEKKKKGLNYIWVQKPIEEELIAGAVKKKGADYLMNFEDISIPDFIDAMMSGVFKANFYMSEPVKTIKKKFTIKMTEDLQKQGVFKLFLRILGMYNISVEKKQNTYFFDKKKSSKLTLKGPVIYGRSIPERFPLNEGDEVTFLIPFYNIDPQALQTIIAGRLPSKTVVFQVKELNLLVINGNIEDVKYALSFIDLLDRAQFKEKSIVMISPKYWDIYNFEKKVKELISAEGIFLKAAEKSKGLIFIPIEKLNSLIVISSVKEWIERVIYWLEKLDVPEAVGEAKSVFSYKLRNVAVEDITEVLKEYTKINITSKKAPQSKTSTKQIITSKLYEESIGIIPVKETNSIVIVATPVQYKKYLDIIKKIDIPRNQVFVEAVIGEITLDTSTQLGLEFWIDKYLYNTTFGTKGGLGVYKGVNQDGTNVVPSGANASIKGVLPGTDFEILLNALVSHSKINIISTPKLTVLENAEAEINVGSDVPVISSESGMYNVGAQSQTQNQSYFPYRSIQYISTGVILKVKPSILTDNKILLEIKLEISEAQENTVSDISSPEILKRTVNTTMIVREGEIAFMGGMIQKKRATSSSGIPILSKIPIIGNLFKKSAKNFRKTELVLFINAKIIRKANDMREIVKGVKKMFPEYLDVEKENEEKK